MTETKNLFVSIEKADRDGRWVMSAGSPDRVGDTIDGKAYESALKKVNHKLIALWQHDQEKPIGFWSNLEHKAGKLIGDLKIADTNLGKMIKALLDAGTPLGASIGFRGLKGEGNDEGGIHFKDIELLETSVVSVPAHPGAYQIAKNFGIDLPSNEGEPQAVSGDQTGIHEDVISKAKAAILLANQTMRKKR